ncbi:MAG: hypothetical protein E7048_02130 [Lentisphaerae bacterium]|nr:hypothetical protein [Lentisphaerota bacterium]
MISTHKLFHNKVVCILLAFFFSIIPVLFFITFFTSESVVFEAKIKLEHGGEVKLYCSDTEKENWQHTPCVISKKLKAAQRTSLRAHIKSSQVKLIRIDLVSAPAGVHEISDMSLKGTKKIRFKYIKNLDCKNLVLERSSNKKAIIKTSSTDSSVIFYSSKAVYSKKELFTPGVFVCMGLCTIVFSFLLIKLDSASWLKEKQDWVLAYFFINLLLIPCWKFDTSADLLNENRRKAVFPRFITQKKEINSNFGREFDKWFSDRFYGRNELIALWQKLLANEEKFRNFSKTGKVYQGKDGWFFYTGDDAIKNFMNTSVFTPRELQENLKNLTALNNFCKANGISFYYFIGPDKHRIYGEAITSFTKNKPDSESKTAQWVRHVQQNSDIKVIYPVDVLKKHKKSGLLYYKTDTHWNKAGGYYSYLELCKVIRKDFPDLPLFIPEKYIVEHHPQGDLKILSPVTVPEDKHSYKVPFLPPKLQSVPVGSKVIKFTNSKGRHSLLLLRDSFSGAMLPFYCYSFKQVRAFWRYTPPEDFFSKLKQEKPDVLILEHVERALADALEEQHAILPFLNSGEK